MGQPSSVSVRNSIILSSFAGVRYPRGDQIEITVDSTCPLLGFHCSVSFFHRNLSLRRPSNAMKSTCRPSTLSFFAVSHLSRKEISSKRVVTRNLAKQPTNDGFVADTPLSVITQDLGYLENALGVDLHAPLETVVEAHDQVEQSHIHACRVMLVAF